MFFENNYWIKLYIALDDILRYATHPRWFALAYYPLKQKRIRTFSGDPIRCKVSRWQKYSSPFTVFLAVQAAIGHDFTSTP